MQKQNDIKRSINIKLSFVKKFVLILLFSFLILNSAVMPLLAAEPPTSTSSWYNQT